VDLEPVVRDAFAYVRSGDAPRLRLDLDPLPFVVEADPGQLRQVLTNLLQNSAEAMGHRGEIRVVARRESGFDVVTVEDEGPGIPEALRMRVAGVRAARHDQGQGHRPRLADLPADRRASRGHDRGRRGPQARSRGAIAAADARGIVMGDARSAAPAGSRAVRSILVVDDEKNIRTTLADILEERGHEVLTADCGEKAVKLCEKRSFDVILMDVRMPGMDGFEAFRVIRRQRRDARVIMMSAYGMHVFQRVARDEGAAAFVQKPLQIERILSLIEQPQER
jgi:CheY-like chemotaxis protein